MADSAFRRLPHSGGSDSIASARLRMNRGSPQAPARLNAHKYTTFPPPKSSHPHPLATKPSFLPQRFVWFGCRAFVPFASLAAKPLSP